MPAISDCDFIGGGFCLKVPASALNAFSNGSLANHITAQGPTEIGVYGDTVGFNSRWRNVNSIPYHVFAPILFEAQLRISEGVELRFDPAGELRATLPTSQVLPPLFVSGYPANQVKFTSSNGSTNWKGITAGPGSSFAFASIEYGGDNASTAALKLIGTSAVRDTTIQFSDGPGLSQIPENPVIGMAEPSSVLSCTFSSNAGSGIKCEPKSWLTIVQASFTGNGGAGVDVDDAVVGVRESDLENSSGGGGVAVVGASSAVDAAFNWWGDSSGPSVSGGGGTGSSITQGVNFNPWFGTSLSGFRIENPYVALLAFAPLSVETTFAGEPSLASDWVVSVSNGIGTEVFQETGSGTIGVNWDGTDGATPPVEYGDGVYDFEITATQTGTAIESVLIGQLELDSDLLIAEISTPIGLQFFGGRIQ